jgi:hypothetical protein
LTQIQLIWLLSVQAVRQQLLLVAVAEIHNLVHLQRLLSAAVAVVTLHLVAVMAQAVARVVALAITQPLAALQHLDRAIMAALESTPLLSQQAAVVAQAQLEEMRLESTRVLAALV